MRGISEDRLKEIAADYPPDHRNHRMVKYLIATECHELQEPWITLDEFLKSGVTGLCWMLTIYNHVVTAKYFDDKFILINTGVCAPFKFITHVMPIHEPEPPK